jgi:hypothetical protein
MSDNKDTVDTFFDDPADALHLARCHASTSWEMEFVEAQIARYEKYGEKMFLSQKQADIIRKIGKLDS